MEKKSFVSPQYVSLAFDKHAQLFEDWDLPSLYGMTNNGMKSKMASVWHLLTLLVRASHLTAADFYPEVNTTPRQENQHVELSVSTKWRRKVE